MEVDTEIKLPEAFAELQKRELLKKKGKKYSLQFMLYGLFRLWRFSRYEALKTSKKCADIDSWLHTNRPEKSSCDCVFFIIFVLFDVVFSGVFSRVFSSYLYLPFPNL